MGDSQTGARGLLARIASSAEYSIAAALFAVCLIVGGALWWLQPAEAPPPAPEPVAKPAMPAAPAAEERAALDDWKQRLGEQFSEIDAQQRQRSAEEEAQRARERADEAAEVRRQAEAATRARKEAEARAREPAPVSKSTASITAKPVAAARPALTQPRQPVVVDAAIDWSSCERPSYPSLSVKRGEEGVVVIAVSLDATAKILEARIAESSSHSKLDRVTMEAIRKCKFTQASENGVAKAATAEVRFNWKLSK